MRDKIFGFLKGVCKSMVNASNKTAEVIDSAKNAIIEISEHKESKFLNIVRNHDIKMAESDRLLSAGVGIIIVSIGAAFIGIGIGTNKIIKGKLMKREV